MTSGRSESEPLWTPSPERAERTRMAELVRRAGVADPSALHRWSVTDTSGFWDLVWADTGVIGHRGSAPAYDGERFFADARLSYAENLLGHPPSPDAPAVIDVGEHDDDRGAGERDGGQGAGERDDDQGDGGTARTTSWAELESLVAAAAAALRADGVTVGDRVAAWMPNVTETIVIALAASSIGAIFTSTSPDFGVDGVVDRFAQVDPLVLVTTDGYRYGGKEFDISGRVEAVMGRLPSLRRVVVVARLERPPIPGTTAWDDWLQPHHGAAPRYERLPFDHPLFVLYSSGTTGKPKCIVHRAGGVLLMHLKEHQYHTDLRPGDRLMYFTTCGWMMWNWQLSALASGVTIVCYDGNPFHPGPTALFDVAERLRLTVFGVSAKYLDACRKTDGLSPSASHDLSTVRTVCSTGSPLHADGFGWVYRHLSADVHLASISGGTDLCGCFVGGDPTAAVWAGEIQGPALGMDVDVFDDDGRPCPPGVDGELVCRPTFPSVPIGFWGDDDGSRFHRAYFERFDGWWTQGDFATWTAATGRDAQADTISGAPIGSRTGMGRRGIVIHGRSDATLNAGGVRIGTAEIYQAVERLDEVTECVAVGQRWDDDTRIVLFVRMADGVELDHATTGTIRSAIRSACSPRHVPARIVAVADIPRTRSNKISELAVTDVVNGRPVRNTDALVNPEALAEFRNRAELAE